MPNLEYITQHEAEQRREVKATLWPIYSTYPHCGGACQQGRTLCLTPEACQIAISDAPNASDDWEPTSTRGNVVFWVLVGLITTALVFGVALLLGWRP
jgi:hypothetical protein